MATLNTKPYLKYILHASLRQHAPEKTSHTLSSLSSYQNIKFHQTDLSSIHKYPCVGNLITPRYPFRGPRFRPREFHPSGALFHPSCRSRSQAECRWYYGRFARPIGYPRWPNVMAAFHALFYQGEDQAKAAIKGMQTFSNTIPFLLFVGPYWASVQYGPFTPAQLSVRTHKPSDSSDFKEAVKAARRLSEIPTQRHIYLLGRLSLRGNWNGSSPQLTLLPMVCDLRPITTTVSYFVVVLTWK